MKRLSYAPLILAFFLLLLSACGENDPAVAKVGDAYILKSELDQRSATSDKMFDSLSGSLSESELMDKKRAARAAILEEMVSERVLLQKAAEQGITETPEMRAEAEEGWRATVEAMTEYVLAAYPTLEGKELEETVSAMLASQGLNEADVVKSRVSATIQDALLARALGELPPPDDKQLSESYEELLADQKARFSDAPEAYEAALLAGDLIVYSPETCRIVRVISLSFDEDVIGLLKQLDSVGDTETQEEMRADQYRLLDETLAGIQKRLDAGEDFTLVTAQWQDSAETNYLTEHTSRFSDEVSNAVWSLKQEGEWTAAIRADYGYYIFYWSDTLEAGESPFEAVRGRLSGELETKVRQEALAELKLRWREEASVEVYADRLV